MRVEAESVSASSAPRPATQTTVQIYKRQFLIANNATTMSLTTAGTIHFAGTRRTEECHVGSNSQTVYSAQSKQQQQQQQDEQLLLSASTR